MQFNTIYIYINIIYNYTILYIYDDFCKVISWVFPRCWFSSELPWSRAQVSIHLLQAPCFHRLKLHDAARCCKLLDIWKVLVRNTVQEPSLDLKEVWASTWLKSCLLSAEVLCCEIKDAYQLLLQQLTKRLAESGPPLDRIWSEVDPVQNPPQSKHRISHDFARFKHPVWILKVMKSWGLFGRPKLCTCEPAVGICRTAPRCESLRNLCIDHKHGILNRSIIRSISS
jgi:hypothetical protein